MNSLELNDLAHLVLVNNPKHNPMGDFSLAHHRIGFESKRHTYSGISILSPELFKNIDQQDNIFPLRNVFRPAILLQQISGTLYSGERCDAGTMHRYTNLIMRIIDT